ncbi:MAG: hypothetical protein B7X10_04905 [Burkholderiales bacterium 21-58-4]|nr:MAG: hypothetical protein B7X10_04905 [Burkholderiales bacterium 21-58-4]
MTAATATLSKTAATRASWLWICGLFMLITSFIACQPAHAQLRVDISGVGATQYPIAIADYSGDPHGQAIADVIRADLSRSGQFQLINAAGANLTAESTISYDQWRNRGADYLAFGSVFASGRTRCGRRRLTPRLLSAASAAFAICVTTIGMASHRTA